MFIGPFLSNDPAFQEKLVETRRNKEKIGETRINKEKLGETRGKQVGTRLNSRDQEKIGEKAL